MVAGLNAAKTPSQHGLYSRHSGMSMATQPASQGRAIGASRSTSEFGHCRTALSHHVGYADCERGCMLCESHLLVGMKI